MNSETKHPTITLRYKCACHGEERQVLTRARMDKEDVLDWMEMARRTITLDHLARSPMCCSKVMEYAKIPINDDPDTDTRIGAAPPVQH